MENKVGRPLKFKTVEELNEKIEKYFNATPLAEWTITGLALALDTYRQTLLNYEDKDEFMDTIKRAKLMVENSYEIDLKKYGRTGTIFALKNFDWKDKNETDFTTKGDKIIPIINVSTNNSDKQNTGNEEAIKDNTGGNVSQQNHIDTPILDSNGSIGQEANANEHSI